MRRDSELKPMILASPVSGHRDMLLVRVMGITFFNFYRGIDGTDSWQDFVNSDWTPPACIVFGRDFNAYYHSWSPPNFSNWRNGEQIATWIESFGLSLISQPGVVTHQ